MTEAPNALSLSVEHLGVGMLEKRHVSAVKRVYRAKATERVRDMVEEKSNDTHERGNDQLKVTFMATEEEVRRSVLSVHCCS